MKISEEGPVVPPTEPIPCGEPCVQTFWEIAKWDDILVESIKRYTLLNHVPQEPISAGPIPEIIEDYHVKPSSEVVIQPAEIPNKLKQAITEYFGVGEPKGFIGDYLSCVHPCSCILDEETRSDEGQEEKTLEIEVKYEDRREMILWSQPLGDIPEVTDLFDPRTGQRPTGFDDETDEIKKGRIVGMHREQRWDIVRTYVAVVKLKVKYSAIIYIGKCLNWDDII